MLSYICWPKSVVFYTRRYHVFNHFYLQMETQETPPTWKRYTIMSFSNISLIQNNLLWVLVFCNSVNFLCIFTFLSFLFLCKSHSFRHENTRHRFFFVFFCTSLLRLWYYFYLFIFIFCLNMSLTTPNSFN